MREKRATFQCVSVFSPQRPGELLHYLPRDELEPQYHASTSDLAELALKQDSRLEFRGPSELEIAQMTAAAIRNESAIPRRPELAVFVLAAMWASEPVIAQRSLPLVHWHHTSWTSESALSVSGAHHLARTPDGYLWLGAVGGLLRFDGVRFVLRDGDDADALRSSRPGYSHPWLVDSQGTLWIGRPDGALVAYRNGRFKTVLEGDMLAEARLVEDGAGRLWLYGGKEGRLLRLANGGLQRAALPPTVPDTGVLRVIRDTASGLWIGTRTQGLWHVDGAHAHRQATPAGRTPDEVQPLLQSRDGAVWAIGVGLGTGLHRLADGVWTRILPPGSTEGLVRGRSAVEAPDGAVWLATHGSGVLRWQSGRIDQFSKAHGLSDVNVHDVMVDAEGSLWASTDAGLDRLRLGAFAVLGPRDGMPFESPYVTVEDDAGEFWGSGAPDRQLFRLHGGALRGRVGPVIADRVPLPEGDSYDLAGAARGGGIWIAPHRGGLVRYRGGRASRFGDADSYPEHRIMAALEAADGAVWVRLDGAGFGRVRDGRYAAIPLPDESAPVVRALAEDGFGRIWVSASGDASAVYVLAGDSVIHRFRLGDGLPHAVSDLIVERGDTLWGASDRALIRLEGGRVRAVPAPALTQLLAAEPRLLAAGEDLWIASEGGVARLAFASLHARADAGGEAPEARVFGAPDGLPVSRTTSRNPRPIIRSRDGRVWISTPAGLAVTEPGAVPANPVAPRVHIEEVSVADTVVPVHAALTIDPNPRRIAFRFTATGLRMPERIQLQYRLEGVDDHWIEGGTPRVAAYSQLRPGAYRFLVRAWNEDGVPGAEVAALAVRVLPAWYQTWWVIAAGMLAIASGGSAAVVTVERNRSRRRAERLQAEFNGILAERTRIARELHDTLLQGFTGIALLLEGLRRQLIHTPDAAPEALSRILRIAEGSLRDARHMVWGLRSPVLEDRDLVAALTEAARETFANDGSVDCRITVRGEQRRLAPRIETTVLRVAREAMTNARKHASASIVELVLHFEPLAVRLTIQDDGHGVGIAELDGAAAGGHWGIAGMRERARGDGGSFSISSRPGAGVLVVLTLPLEDPSVLERRPG